MTGNGATPVTFSHLKYGQPLAIDASSNSRWTGIVPDGEPHVLDFHEFLLVSAGKADLLIGDRRERVAGPTVLFTPPGVVRRVEVIEPLALELVVFSGDALRKTAWLPALSRCAAGSLAVRDRGAVHALSHVARSMAAELVTPQPDSATMLDALLAQFMITLARLHAGSPEVKPGLVSRFEQLLDRRFRHQHSVAAYAAALGVSADHLSAMTRSRYGLSAKAMIDRRLFGEAARLLASTPRSIAAIGLSLGFDEPSQFSRAFKRACGESPRDFRGRR